MSSRWSSLLIGGLIGGLLWWERKQALRPRVEPGSVRAMRNLAVAATGALVVAGLESPLVTRLARDAEKRRRGLVYRLPIPGWARAVLCVVLMDYTLYLWHVLNHRIPLLWRFHAVHHVDLDLDTSTAVRFHFGELALSAPFRAAQVLLIGVSPRDLSLWQRLLFLSILFHHSNLRLPLRWERRLARFVMTPRLHGIHHSTEAGEVNSNWSSGLTVWDRLHGTLRADVAQASIRVGVSGYLDPADVSLPKVLALPFREAPPPPQAKLPPAGAGRIAQLPV